MNKPNLNYIPLLLVIVLVAGFAFLTDGQRSNAADPPPTPTIVFNSSVTVVNGSAGAPTSLTSALGSLRNQVGGDLPSFTDFQQQNPLTQTVATQPVVAAQPIPHADSATGLFDPTLGKIVIVDGLSRKLKCDGLESNPDFAGLTETQKMLAQDICAHL